MLIPLPSSSINRYLLSVVVASIVLGLGTGFALAKSNRASSTSTPGASSTTTAGKTSSTDNQTFKDFAEGTIQKRSAPKDPSEYVEGTHMLIRQGAVPVALTSSVVDLSQYENKKVKVYGETQKAIKEGWLMDVGKVEVEQ